MQQYKRRQPAYKLSIKRRCFSFNADQRIKSKLLQKHILHLYQLIRSGRVLSDGRLHGRLSRLLKVMMITYLKGIVELVVNLPPTAARYRTIDSFTNDQCWNFFETRKEDLPRLLKGLRFPGKVVFNNGGVMSGEECMLRGLYELVSGTDQYEIAENVFGLDQPTQSRAFSYFIYHIYDNFLDLLTNNICGIASRPLLLHLPPSQPKSLLNLAMRCVHCSLTDFAEIFFWPSKPA